MAERPIPYPPAPWTLEGPWLFALSLIDLRKARELVPAEMNILQPWPGKSLGGFLLASYGRRSTLPYHELIVFPAVVMRSGKVGVWISHIYADLARSVLAGRQMWGLPKELASFRWSRTRIEAGLTGRDLLMVDYRQSPFQLPVPVLAAAFGDAAQDAAHPAAHQAAQEIRWFWGHGAGVTAPVKAKIVVPAGSPITGLGLNQPFIVFAGRKVRIRLGHIRRVGLPAIRSE